MKTTEQQLLEIVTGQAPLSALSKLGAELDVVDGNLCLRSPLPALDVQPKIDDILRGFRAYQDQPQLLTTWAFFLLAETAIDLSKLEESPSGNKLLGLLWNASKGETIAIALLDESGNELTD